MVKLVEAREMGKSSQQLVTQARGLAWLTEYQQKKPTGRESQQEMRRNWGQGTEPGIGCFYGRRVTPPSWRSSVRSALPEVWGPKGNQSGGDP